MEIERQKQINNKKKKRQKEDKSKAIEWLLLVVIEPKLNVLSYSVSLYQFAFDLRNYAALFVCDT